MGKAYALRQTCPELYRVYLGPQILPVFLGWYESASGPWIPDLGPRLTPELAHRQPVLADEVQTFKALITVHKVLQEGHPIVLKEAQANVNWIQSLSKGVTGSEGLRGVFATTRRVTDSQGRWR